MRPKIYDDDMSQITITADGNPIMAWTYTKEDERVEKMRQAQYFCDGFQIAKEGFQDVSAPDGCGSAFPNQPFGPNGFPFSVADKGMTLRDWFAGQALAGVLIICRDDTAYQKAVGDPDEYLSTQAYRMADPMLKARSR